MPESFEKYFTKTPEEPKSPEQIKEEKALLLAEEIKEIKERMEKEGKTSEDYQSINELIQGIEELFEEKERDYEAEVKTIVANLEKVLKEGYVARGLAGVNTEEAEEFRRKHFADNPTLFARSYSTSWTVYDGVICRGKKGQVLNLEFLYPKNI
jgi:hypothetical protein